MLCLFLADTRFGSIAGFPPFHGSFRQDSMRGILSLPTHERVHTCTAAKSGIDKFFIRLIDE